MRPLFLPVLISLLLSSCSFDSFFLLPVQLPRDAEKVSIHDPIEGSSWEYPLGEDLAPLTEGREGPGYGVESVLFENQQGTELHGWVLTPPDSIASNGISLFVLHGNAVNLTKHCGLMKPFLQRGYKAFIFDYSGYGFSRGKAARKTLLPDSRAAFDFIAEHPRFQEQRWIIYGQSLGGHLAPTLFLDYPDAFEGMILEGAFSTPKAIARDKAGIFGQWFTAQEHTALQSIQNVDVPILIVHGTEDEVVPFEQGKLLFEHAKEPKSFLKSKMGHLEGPFHHADRIDAEIRKMLED